MGLSVLRGRRRAHALYVVVCVDFGVSIHEGEGGWRQVREEVFFDENRLLSRCWYDLFMERIMYFSLGVEMKSALFSRRGEKST